jgi:hypothetical protein
MPDTATLLGLMVGFLVMGVIGIYVGDQVMASSDQFNGTQIQPSMLMIKDSWGLMVSVMKVMIIVTIAAITFLLIQQAGLIGSPSSRYGGSYGGSYGGRHQQVTQETPRQAPGRVEPPAQPAAQQSQEKSAEPEKEKDKRDRYEAIKV